MSFFGCKSSPENYKVEPLDLLDLNSDFYISIPSQADPDFITYFLKNNLNSFTEDNIKSLSSRINTIYCGINHKKNNYTIQASVLENIPKNYITKTLRKNKTINNNTITINNYDYTLFNYSSIDFTFPDNNLALIGRDIDQMLTSYDSMKSTGFSENVWEDSESYEYLKSATDEIRFYSSKPVAFLSLLIGHEIDLHLRNVKGSFKIDSSFPSQYEVDLILEFKNEKFLKASKALLNMTFGLTGSDSIILDTNKLEIKNIQIKKEQLYKLLVL